MKFLKSKTLRYFKQRVHDLAENHKAGKSYGENLGGRNWEDYYRRRWQHDKVVRSTHGVNCTGSCSFDVFVKDGIVVWEAQKTDYPTPHPDFPDYEPRGCPRGTSASWYVYSPLRVRYPYIRESLYKLWQAALAEHGDPVLAWNSIQTDPIKRRTYHQARGKGGFVRFSWDEAAQLVAASLVNTIKEQGADRIFGFTPLPAMSMTSFASGARFLTLIGASMISFYDWYCDLPPASPQIWGEQTDVCESADWYNAGYIICWGSNIPQTRTPDAHFYTECRYRGTKIAAVSPDYADFTKFADNWLPVIAGTDGALAMSMVHVVVKEFFVDRQVPYFIDYAKRFTDLPFLIFIDEYDAKDSKNSSGLTAGRFLRATDLDKSAAQYPNNPEWKLVVHDLKRNGPAVPMGSIGSRYGEDGTWVLDMRDCATKEELEPALSLADTPQAEWTLIDFPVFHEQQARSRMGAVPVIRMNINGKERLVTTVYDILLGSLSVDRGHGGDVAKGYDDAEAYATPAWQEAITGVKREDVENVAREFAATAEQTKGRSLIIMGAGINHWYNNDNTYRAIISLTTLCGCQGVNGGGWAHYVGQEKVRPLAGWGTVTMASDWQGPPRLMNGTSFYYFATDAWRHELLDIKEMCPPGMSDAMPAHPADCNALAARLGWLPFFPQFKENPQEICRKAVEAGAVTDEDIIKYAVERLKSGDLQLAVDDPDHRDNVPRVMIFWRTNPLGCNVKGHEYFLHYLLGTQASILGNDSATMPQQVKDTPLDIEREGGKLDLMVTSEIRFSTSCVYSDVVLPAAHWYEYNDLNTTDMHPFIHPFNAAVDPAWEARPNWEQFDAIAKAFVPMAEKHLGTRKDLVATALQHDSPGEIAQPYGEVKDWRKGEVEPIPGKTMFNLKVVERNYADVYKKFSALGPNVCKPGGVGSKGVAWSCEPEYQLLKERLGVVTEPGCSQGMPRITTGKDACEIVLSLSPETNGAVSVRSWAKLEKQTGLSLDDMSRPIEGSFLTFESITARPAKGFTSPTWSGIETDGRVYTAFAMNVERLVPFRTLSGRQHFYLDHAWMQALGESLPVYRPPLALVARGEVNGQKVPRTGNDLVLNFLSPHSKWSIHSSYSDILLLRTLSRGGGEIWLNHEDAGSAGIADNDWIECFNNNGVFMGRALVTHRMPRGKLYIYHAQERCINVPLSGLSGTRGGTHNSLTRALVKPTQMLGGYAQLSYSYNYHGPTGCQRDEYVVVRKVGEVKFNED